tara:strand:- start:2353 stop:2907 length:555 start_codon:yes stop_codon:yes gene_type:complete
VKKLYREYFQKSKVFLYPLLGIKKGVKFVPIQTYISWNGYYTEDMNKFLCLYSVDINNPEFEKFEKLHLKTHPNFEEYHVIDDKNHLYVFDLSKCKRDVNKFKKGKYSKMTKKSKEIICNFFGEKGTIADYVESYLYPDYYWDDYSKILNINIEDLIEVGELCDIPDLKKEDLKKDFVNVELFK